MHRTRCPRERELLAAVVGGRWPAGVDANLAAHVADCRSCATLAELASALVLERDSAASRACLPPSAVVWWRAQLRARQEAAHKAARPINAALGVAIASIAGLAAALIPLISGWLGAWLERFGAAIPSVHLPTVSLPTTLSNGWLPLQSAVPIAVLVAATIWLIAAPLALYWVLSSD